MDHAELSKKGRNFNCQKCPEKVMNLRRCQEDRWDFTDKDASLFPIRLSNHGNAYGFCPAKVTWDNELIQLYQILVLSFETKTMLTSGGIAEQPGWYIDLLGWFVNRYDQLKFYYRASSILGGKSKSNPTQKRASRGRHKR